MEQNINEKKTRRTEWCEEDEANIGCLYLAVIIIALGTIAGFIITTATL